VQVKFLRAIEQRAFRRLGGKKEIDVDIRVIAATNRDLKEEVKKGLFREDLFYRLNVVPLWVPPLRERPGDISELARFIFESACRQNRKKLDPLGEDVLEAMRAYSWPGNVRELKNVMERMVVLATKGRLKKADLPSEILSLEEGSGAASGEVVPMDDAQRVHLLKALEKCGWNRTLAAKKLGISRKTLFNKIKRYDLKKS
jgi:DNA-binding NtrC family response regulator